jgi:hypothetical protein
MEEKMRLSNKEIENLLEKTQLAFVNAQNRADIKEKMAADGCSDAQLQAAIDLRSRLEAKYLEGMKLRGEVKEFTDQYNRKFEAEYTRYIDMRDYSRKCLRGKTNEAVRDSLRISGDVNGTFSGFAVQAKELYQVISTRSDIQEKVAKFAITPGKAQEGLNGIAELEWLNTQQQQKEGDAQRALRERDDLYKELFAFYSDIKTIAVKTLRNLPQLREVMGILERTKPLRKKKKEEPVTPEPVNPPVVKEPQPAQAVKETGTKTSLPSHETAREETPGKAVHNPEIESKAE